MTPDETVCAAVARLGAVEWERHGYRTWSKAKLMLEYFRRIARWSDAYGCAEMEYLSVPIAKWRERASRPPLPSLDPAALDEIDRAGSMKQFGYVMGPGD